MRVRGRELPGRRPPGLVDLMPDMGGVGGREAREPHLLPPRPRATMDARVECAAHATPALIDRATVAPVGRTARADHPSGRWLEIVGDSPTGTTLLTLSSVPRLCCPP